MLVGGETYWLDPATGLFYALRCKQSYDSAAGAAPQLPKFDFINAIDAFGVNANQPVHLCTQADYDAMKLAHDTGVKTTHAPLQTNTIYVIKP